ncbi:Peroxyureidoacrylate/ureidoacrylate amidohydrolase RutB [Pigmentiphaga humi]|uniref:Peroxyureidoacrylate/ureidoacrylate amidohydrolase RutB n=1 Tax=Pigmentiphaga humi TaxID=2478468 RepID=A0A3P4B9F3_9BURK|nr:isochorismatase family cysteine hydrolase [Pigmentiphaga humi]VCU72146.1 Peroxyureidoacrylate/ureidoacrylate amidohydrolase RutB [Pigmentiphaga humi]
MSPSSVSPAACADDTLPVTLEARLAPAGSALLVIDMQNDFCAARGYVQTVMGKDVSTAASIVPPIQALANAARAAGVPVFWLRADYTRQRLPPSMQVKLAARGITQDCCAPGSWGSAWFEVAPEAGEAVFTKHTYSGFHQTGLHEALQAQGIRTLVFAGVQTHICVESTLRAAHTLGYYCVVAEDAVASHSPAGHAAALDNVRFLFGDVCPAAAVRQAWSAA